MRMERCRTPSARRSSGISMRVRRASAIAGKECGARQLLRACAERLRTEPVPPGLRSRCQALSCSPQAGHPWFRSAVTFAIAALLIVFTGSLLAIVTRQSDALLAAQLTADHMKCFGLFRPDPGTTMDAAQVERMLDATLRLRCPRAGRPPCRDRRAGGKGRTRECATMPVCRRPRPALDVRVERRGHVAVHPGR